MTVLTNEQRERLGRANYNAYTAEVGGVAVNGDTLPPWEELDTERRAGWEMGALAVRFEVRRMGILRAGE